MSGDIAPCFVVPLLGGYVPAAPASPLLRSAGAWEAGSASGQVGPCLAALGLVAAFVGRRATQPVAQRRAMASGARSADARGAVLQSRRLATVACQAAKKSEVGGEPIKHKDTIYIKVHTGRYIGELDGTTRKEWVKARGTKKDPEHALIIERKAGEGEVTSGDVVNIVMPTGVHMDVLGSAVRARYYDPRGEWQKITIIKQDGGVIRSGDSIFLRGHQGEYMDGNPLEKAPDGEVKARWRDEGEWQIMTIEK